MQKQDPQFWFIELLAWWEGRINTRPLMRYFGQSRQSASAHIQRYRESHPDALNYHPRHKAYEPTDTFKPHYLSGDVSEYLNWVTGIAPAPPDNQINHESIQHPPRQISPQVIRPLVSAVRENRRLDVEYLSVTSADTDGRVIAPHTLVNTGLRWHVRAFCERSKAYRDFVLSRFRGQPELMDRSDHTAEQDTAWNTRVQLAIEPDPRLSQAKRQVIENDYRMQNGTLIITTRAALAQYTLQDMQVSTKTLDGNPEAQQLVLANYDEVKEWLF
ncbi:WYL domain-containing protein [Natronospirillum operosum]|uniref:WYL domain-containing protein n=1 Tax=Natronospirillum operosum TaxID=2759953 RepID=A0A4Z0WEL8_9GAMM|nr:WYL domain-containing protein [Natronospirillum operosum]TGG95068.1 WYL domain-containing protein [Natronospirillum operosum]